MAVYPLCPEPVGAQWNAPCPPSVSEDHSPWRRTGSKRRQLTSPSIWRCTIPQEQLSCRCCGHRSLIFCASTLSPQQACTRRPTTQAQNHEGDQGWPSSDSHPTWPTIQLPLPAQEGIPPAFLPCPEARDSGLRMCVLEGAVRSALGWLAGAGEPRRPIPWRVSTRWGQRKEDPPPWHSGSGKVGKASSREPVCQPARPEEQGAAGTESHNMGSTDEDQLSTYIL